MEVDEKDIDYPKNTAECRNTAKKLAGSVHLGRYLSLDDLRAERLPQKTAPNKLLSEIS